MNVGTLSRTQSPAWAWILAGGLAVGTLDAAFATGFWALAAGLPWTRVFQSVAAGLLGREASFAGGAATAWLGLGLHYVIATLFVVAYALVALRFRGLVRKPLVYGLAYGLLLYVVMNFVVIPLSAIGQLPKFDNTAWVAASIAVHAAVGVLCARFARRALRTRQVSPGGLSARRRPVP